jgi:PAS domain S-box-containing protein
MAAATALMTEYQVQADARIGEALAAAGALQAKLSETAAALDRAGQEAAAERHAASEEAMRHRLEFEGELAEAATYRQALERALADQEAALQGVREEHASAVAAAAAQLDDYQKHAEARKAEAAADAARALELAEERASVERQAAAERETALHEREAALKMTLEQAVARADAAEKEVADRDNRLEEQAARQRESAEAAAQALADVEQRFRVALEAGARDTRTIEQLQTQLRVIGQQLDASRSERDGLKIEADRVPQLLKQIDDAGKAHRREFDRAPIGLLQCSPTGQTVRVSRALADLLGYDSPDSLNTVDFATEVFESGDELKWMIDRCLASRALESIDTTWKRKNGGRIVVRLRAVAITPGSDSPGLPATHVDLAVHDITALRELEEKLHAAQRMEAVARYAAEVAITCDKVLKHVEEEGQQWLAHTDGDAARYHGELLLGEVARAAKFLQQLSVYGAEQKNALDLVDLTKVLRDFVPVLRRVAGSDIELVLPGGSTAFNLDVDAERVQRMLVNVAAFGRQRMPLGGRLVFEVAAAMVDRQFVDKHPSVRPGAHVLLTVNEVRRTLSPELSAAVRSAAGDASPYPGVDLGTLQALVSDCGGHLWMMAEATGDMVLKIHLPRRVLDRPDGRPAAKRLDRGRLANQVAN